MVAMAVATGSAQAKATMAEAHAKTPPSVAGAWLMTIDSPHGVMTFKLDVKVEGSKLTGTLSNDMMGEHTLTGEVAEGKVTFKFTAEGAEMAFNGKLKDADSLVGTLSSTMDDMVCTATRVKAK
jgi:hypothetical protein